MASVFQILMWMIKTCSFCNFVTVFTTKRLYMCLVFLWCLCHACLDSLTARSPFSCFVNRPCILCGVKNKKLVAHFLLPPPPLHMLLWQGVLWVRLGARWGANRGPVREITRGLFYRTLHQTDAAVTGDSCVGVDVGAGRIQSVGFFFSWQWKYTTQLTFSGHLRAWMLMSTSGVITERLPHSAAAAPPPGFFKLTSPKCLLADKGWAFEAGNPNHLKLTDESFSYKPPESFIILVTMLHCNVLPHATMLYSYARCSNTVYSDRMFSLYHTPCQPQIVKIVFDLK